MTLTYAYSRTMQISGCHNRWHRKIFDWVLAWSLFLDRMRTKTDASNRNIRSILNLQVAIAKVLGVFFTSIAISRQNSWRRLSDIRLALIHSIHFWDLPPHCMWPGYDPLKGVHVSWGPPFKSQIAWIIIYYLNRNSLAVSLSIIIY